MTFGSLEVIKKKNCTGELDVHKFVEREYFSSSLIQFSFIIYCFIIF